MLICILCSASVPIVEQQSNTSQEGAFTKGERDAGVHQGNSSDDSFNGSGSDEETQTIINDTVDRIELFSSLDDKDLLNKLKKVQTNTITPLCFWTFFACARACVCVVMYFTSV